jgi:hypothetical protein
MPAIQKCTKRQSKMLPLPLKKETEVLGEGSLAFFFGSFFLGQSKKKEQSVTRKRSRERESYQREKVLTIVEKVSHLIQLCQS